MIRTLINQQLFDNLTLSRELEELQRKYVNALKDHIKDLEESRAAREERDAVLGVMQSYLAIAAELEENGSRYDAGARQAIIDYTNSLCLVLGVKN